MKGEPLFESKIYNELDAFTKIAIEEFIKAMPKWAREMRFGN